MKKIRRSKNEGRCGGKTCLFNPLADLMSRLKPETLARVKAQHVFTAGGNGEQTLRFREHHDYGASVEVTGRHVYFEVFRFSESDGKISDRYFVIQDDLDSPEKSDRIARHIDSAIAWMQERL